MKELQNLYKPGKLLKGNENQRVDRDKSIHGNSKIDYNMNMSLLVMDL